jgi:hypothetical protein
LVIDPRTETFADDLYRLINATWERQEDLRRDFAARREEYLDLTEANLASVYSHLRDPLPTHGGAYDAVPHPAGKRSGIVRLASVATHPYSPRERRLGRESLTNAIAADDAEELADVQLSRAGDELAATRRRLTEGKLRNKEFLAALRRRAHAAKREGRRLEALVLGLAVLVVSHDATKRPRRR